MHPSGCARKARLRHDTDPREPGPLFLHPHRVIEGVELSVLPGPPDHPAGIVRIGVVTEFYWRLVRHSIKSASQPPSSRSEEHTSELQSLMRISYAVFCLKKKNKKKNECNQYELTHKYR